MTTSLTALNAWLCHELPRLNRAVLYDNASPTTVAQGLAAAVLPELPAPDALTPRQAQQLIVTLGLAGSSVARHFQEVDPVRKQDPERSFDGLFAGPERLPFQAYFAALAARTGTGHEDRDAYASLVIWNVPTTEVRYQGRTLAVLPGVGDDNTIRSYTGDAGEQWFFEFVKRGQTIELAANQLLAPLADGDVGLASADGLRRVRLATTLLKALRLLFIEFTHVGQGEGMQPQYFMDVFRQFAVHWRPGDIPPSGALDVDALKRDFLLGTKNEPYVRHIHRMLPALLDHERRELTALMQQPSLSDRLLRLYGLDPATLAELSEDQLGALVATHPALADWYHLLSAHARAAGGHLMLSKRFLFNPQRRRDAAGIGDKPLVSNRRGTTGMDESILDRLTRMRREHPLAAFRHIPNTLTEDAEEFPVDDVEIVSQSGLFANGAVLGSTPAQRRRGPGYPGEARQPRFGRQVIGE